VRIYQDGGVSAEVEYISAHLHTNESLLRILHALVINNVVPATLDGYLTKSLLDSLKKVCRPAKDAQNVTGSDYVFTTKVDGVRQWCIESGSMWYYILPYKAIVRIVVKGVSICIEWLSRV
jgi:hypothetical protein